MPRETEAESIDDRDQEESGPAEALAGAVDEPTHRRHHDECAEVVGDVGEVEAGATPSSAFERGPEGFNLGCRDQPLSVSPFDVLFRNFHGHPLVSPDRLRWARWFLPASRAPA